MTLPPKDYSTVLHVDLDIIGTMNLFLCLLAFLAVLALYTGVGCARRSHRGSKTSSEPQDGKATIEPLTPFDWKTTQPEKHMPYKPKYNLTMCMTFLYCNVTNESYPLILPPLTSGVDILRKIGGLVEDDLLFLLPASDGDGYTLQAFVTCFPNGFNTRTKLGLKLRDIHAPVPGYREKLERSMDRWFDRLEVGTVVKRFNWTIQPHGRLFSPSGNHLYEGDEVQPIEADIDQTYVRTERQFVHRLPCSKAILFPFKTYLYPIRDIKAEGLGETLAQAVDGLQGGNVPGMHYYKRAVVWGDSVKRYLRV